MITKLELRRREIGLSQKDLAKKIGYHNSLISKYEQGFRLQVSDRFKRKVSKALGISQKDLFEGSILIAKDRKL